MLGRWSSDKMLLPSNSLAKKTQSVVLIMHRFLLNARYISAAALEIGELVQRLVSRVSRQCLSQG